MDGRWLGKLGHLLNPFQKVLVSGQRQGDIAGPQQPATLESVFIEDPFCDEFEPHVDMNAKLHSRLSVKIREVLVVPKPSEHPPLNTAVLWRQGLVRSRHPSVAGGEDGE